MSQPLTIQPAWKISKDAILITTFEPDVAKRTIVYANPAFAELTGFDAQESIGKLASMGEGAKTDQKLLQDAEPKLRANEPYECTLIKYRSDKSEYHYALGLAPLLNPDNSVTYLVASGHMVPSPRPNANPAKQDQHVGLALPMPLMHFGDGKLPKHLTSTAETDSIKALWEKLRGKNDLPLRSAFMPQVLKPWITHVSIAAWRTIPIQ